MNYYMVYRKDSDGTISKMIATAKEDYARQYADGLNESAKKYRLDSVYYYNEEEDHCASITYNNDSETRNN